MVATSSDRVPISVSSLDAARELIGHDLGPTAPVLIDQSRIDDFARVTGDDQWIHVDPRRASLSSLGTTIAHGYLVQSLIPGFSAQLYSLDFGTVRLNYGSNRVRFPTAVPAGTSVKGHARFIEVREAAQGALLTVQFTVAADGSARPACIADVMTFVKSDDPKNEEEDH